MPENDNQDISPPGTQGNNNQKESGGIGGTEGGAGDKDDSKMVKVFENLGKDLSKGFQKITDTIDEFKNNIQDPRVSIAIKVIRLIILLFLILIVLLIGYIIYKLHHAYLRPFSIGRSIDAEAYMKDNIRLMVNNLHVIHKYFTNGGPGGGDLRNIVMNLFRQGCVPANDLSEYAPSNAPFLYFNFMFKRALTGNLTQWKKSELNLIKRLAGMETIEINGKEEDIYTSSNVIRDEIADYIKNKTEHVFQLQEYFGRLDCSYQGRDYNSSRRGCRGPYQWCKKKEVFPMALRDFKAEICRQHLNLLVNRYSRDIERMYDLRKSGGIGNFVIYSIYMNDYMEHIFKERIPNIWRNFIPRVRETGTLYWNVVTSERVAAYMARLPVVIGGVDRFTDMTPEEKERLERNTDNGISYENEGGGVIEHFFGGGGGFGNLIKSLAQLLPNLLKLIMALIEAITNPLKILRIILGLLIGLIIYIIYLVLAVIGPLFMIPAFVVILALSLWSTVIWVAIFLALAIIFFILWILDFATNGLVFSLLRCESVPNAWHEYPGYIFENITRRFFMCNFRCGNRYLPKGWFCTKMYKHQPSFCPQQLIMNIYEHNLLGKGGEHPSLANNPQLYDYRTDVEYVMANKEEKKRILQTFYANQKQFSKKCDEALSRYSYITAHICKHIDQLADDINIPQAQIDVMKRACHKCFCKYYYLKGGCRMSQRPYIRIIKTEKKLESKFIHLLDENQLRMFKNEIRNDIRRAGDKTLQNKLQESLQILKKKENENIYVINDGYEHDIELRKHNLSSNIFNIPNSASRFKFCESFIDETPPDLTFGNRKKGAILIYVIYAILMLVIVSFGFIIMFNSIKQRSESK